jgi:hypothetical protein
MRQGWNPPSGPRFNPNQGITTDQQRTDWYPESDPEPREIRFVRIPVPRRWWRSSRFRAVLGVTTAVLLVLAGIAVIQLQPTPPPPITVVPIPAERSEVPKSADLAIPTRYIVEGPGRANITYQTLEGEVTEYNLPLPWTVDLDVVEPKLSAKSRSENRQTITCRILQYGETIGTSTAAGMEPECVTVGAVG